MLKEPEYMTNINAKIMEMQEIVESIGEQVQNALKNRSSSLKPVATELCREAQIKEELIVEMCVESLIRYHPFASDLRAITVAMKISYDLSRVCRYLRNVTEVLEEVDVKDCEVKEVCELLKNAREMVRQSLRAYFEKDQKAAMNLIKSDESIDEGYRMILRKYAVQKAGGNCILLNGLTARIVERMADHACYMAQETTYLVTGRRTDYW
jgi:phosphate transport system protein